MLNARQLDLAILFNDEAAHRWSVTPLLDEALYLIAAPGFPGFPDGETVSLASLAGLPLAMPTRLHGLRNVLTSAADRESLGLNVTLEIDSLAMVMDAVGAGLVATIQPGAALRRVAAAGLRMARVADDGLIRRNLLVSLSDEELSPAGLAARVVMRDVARDLVAGGAWAGASSIHDS
jgi:LysR family tcuABC transcriptional regulator